MLRKTELLHGRLPGELDCEWRAVGDYECLTGHIQAAINLLLWEERESATCASSTAPPSWSTACARRRPCGTRSPACAVAGSWPIWGRYMTLRYPNWAAKYHCDALVALSMRLASEHARLTCASS